MDVPCTLAACLSCLTRACVRVCMCVFTRRTIRTKKKHCFVAQVWPDRSVTRQNGTISKRRRHTRSLIGMRETQGGGEQGGCFDEVREKRLRGKRLSKFSIASTWLSRGRLVAFVLDNETREFLSFLFSFFF